MSRSARVHSGTRAARCRAHEGDPHEIRHPLHFALRLMGYFKVDDILLSHWRAKIAGPVGVGIWTMGGLYCATNLTDGHIPVVVAKTLLPSPATAIKKALESGLWMDCSEHEKCYLMRAYHADSSGSERQPTREEVERRRRTAREKKQGQRRSPSGQYAPGDGTLPIEDGSRPPGVPGGQHGDSTGTTEGVPPSQSISLVLPSEELSSPPPGDGEDASGDPPKIPATRLPKDWMPTASHLARAKERGLNLNYQAEAFRLHAETHDRRASVWNGAFTTWLTRADPAKEPKTQPASISPQDEWRYR